MVSQLLKIAQPQYPHYEIEGYLFCTHIWENGRYNINNPWEGHGMAAAYSK